MSKPVIFSSDQLRLVKTTQVGHRPERILSEVAFDDFGCLQVEALTTPHFTLTKARFDLKQDVLLQIPNPGNREKFRLCAMSAGEVRATFSGKNAVDVSGGKGAFHFNPVMDEVHQLCSHTPSQTIAVEIAPDYLTQLLFELDETERGALTQLKDSILRGEFINFPFPAAALPQRIVSDIDNCPLSGTLGNLMLEGSLQQLIAWQFSVLSKPKHDHRSIHSRDREIMYGMKEYITANFNDDHSIPALSRRFGISQTKLKIYFKELFGVPVIEFIFNLRMAHAQTLLYDHGMYIADVALIAGYKNPNHFATAFRRKFGVSPSEIRKRG